jgi:hypothetical protein
MEHSILLSTKKVLGIDPSYTAFDQDILTHINSVFSTLSQMGLGSVAETFYVEGEDEVWTDFEPDPVLVGHIRTFVYLKVRLIFDPPSTSFVLAAMERQAAELEFRLSLAREQVLWTDPDPDIPNEEDLPIPGVIDGGEL